MTFAANIIIKVGLAVMAILIPLAVAQAIALLQKKLNTEKYSQTQKEIEIKRRLAWVAVNFIEQVFDNLDGAGKFAKAEEWLANEANEAGIIFTPDQAKGFIESSIKLMKYAIAAKA